MEIFGFGSKKSVKEQFSTPNRAASFCPKNKSPTIIAVRW